ncbi:hypothetical protein F6B93_00725 [Mycobacterium spongiae]|uniref:Threonine/serine exporter-like N-terminal domain-containing protein n=2 Tax=Mycobacterium spongiae TaxID=886343 RepID=A0A975K2W3_9MYCO|nr:hypothetical protein F6B93_00725 [Mycobacterium spongiae]
MTTGEAGGWPRRLWRAVRKEELPPPVAPPDTFSADEIAVMLRSLGIAMLEVGQPTNMVSARLVLIASRYTTSTVRLAVLPTVIMVKVDNGPATEVDESNQATVRLDQAGAISDVVQLAEAGAIAPGDAVAAVTAVRELPSRFGSATTIFGHAMATIGFGLMLNPTWKALLAYAVLGAVGGLALAIGRQFSWFGPIQATVSAFLVSFLAIDFFAGAANEGLLRIIAPPLIALLPGFSLTTGAIELASGQMIAGASRLVYGVAQLMLLAAGVALGVRLVGLPSPHQPSAAMGEWSLYLAIVVMAIGMYLYLSAPRGSLIWLVMGLGVAVIAQDLSGMFVDQAMSGALGAFIAVPFAMFASGFRSAPPRMVMLLTVFWGLVPGALSFIRFTQRAASDTVSVSTLADTGVAIFAIALGTLIGFSLFRRLATSVRTQGAVALGNAV